MAGSDLNYAIIKIQTLLWETAYGQKIYISVFPAFIIKYNKISTDLIEFISTNVGRGENVFNCIDNSGNLLECEDILIRSCQRVNTSIECKKFAALLNARYTEIFNTTMKCIRFIYLRWLNKYERNKGEEAPIGLILCARKSQETVELLELGKSGIHVAQYITQLPPKEVFEEKLHKAILKARVQLEQRKTIK